MKNKSLSLRAFFCFLAIAMLQALCANAQSPVDKMTPEDIEWVELSSHDEKHAAFDRYGDPLPAGALQRLGTLRYRRTNYGTRHLSFLEDNRTLLAHGNTGIQPAFIDALTGQTQSMIAWKSPYLHLRSAAASPNGRFLLVVAFAFERETKANRSLCKVWDASNRQVVASCMLDVDLFTLNATSAVSNDGSLVAMGGNRGEVYLWHVNQPKPKVLEVANKAFEQLEFTRDSRLIVARGSQSVYVWSLTEQRLKFTLDVFWGASSMAISSDDRLLAIGDRDVIAASLWDLNDGKRIRLIRTNAESKHNFGTGVAFSSDDRRLLVTIPESETINVFEVATGRRMQEVRQAGVLPRTLAISPDGKHVAGGVGESSLRVWTTDSLQDLTSELVGHIDGPHAMVFTHDEQRLVSSEDNGLIIVWDVQSGLPIHRLYSDVNLGGGGAITALALSPDEKLLLSNGFGVGLDCWDLESGKIVYRFAQHTSTGIYGAHACGFSADGSKFFSFGPDFYFRAWDRRTGKALLEELPFPAGAEVELNALGDMKQGDDPFAAGLFGQADAVPEVYASFLSADGDTLAYFADKLYFVDTATGRIRRAVSLEGAHNLVLTDDLRTAAVAAHREGSISIRDTADGTEALIIETHADNVTPYCFSNDGSLLAVRQQVSQDAGQNASTLAIYNTTTGEQLYHIRDEELVGSNSSRFSPDITKLAVSQRNSAILLLELQHFRVAPP